MKGVNNSEREGERREKEKDGKKVDREMGRQWPLRILPSAISKSLLYSAPPPPPLVSLPVSQNQSTGVGISLSSYSSFLLILAL